MFANLQNKIDLKRIKEDSILIDNEFAFNEDFDVVNQTLLYFEKKKNETNDIIIKEEIIEFDNDDMFDFVDASVEAEQKFLYNDEDTVDMAKEEASKDDEESSEEDREFISAISESYVKHHRERKPLPLLMEEANKELKTELDKYRMSSADIISQDTSELDDKNEWAVESLFDKESIDLAKHEHLEHLHTINWLEKQLVDYRGAMKQTLDLGKSFMVDNGLRKLDVNDSEEIKNKIKDLNESIAFLKFKLNEEKSLVEGVGSNTFLISWFFGPIFGGLYSSVAVKDIIKNTLMQKPSFAKKVAELKRATENGDKVKAKELKKSIKLEVKAAAESRNIIIAEDAKTEEEVK